MRGYKAIKDFTYNECVEFLKRNPSSPNAQSVRERRDWLKVQDDRLFSAVRTISDVESYLNQCSVFGLPGIHRNEAKQMVDTLYFEQNQSTKKGLKRYLNRYPEGLHAQDAENLLRLRKWNRNVVFIILLVCSLLIAIMFYDMIRRGDNHEKDWDPDPVVAVDSAVVDSAAADSAVVDSVDADISYLKVDGNTYDKTSYFGESGGREHFDVSTSASSYETWGVPSWCSIENKTSTGFTLVCTRNTDSSSKSGYMIVEAAGQEIRIDIKQEASSGPSANITSIEQEDNVFSGNSKGMRINLEFDVSGMQNRTVKATAWFYYGDNTTKLNNGYGGQVNVSKSDIAPYENTTFTMTLFMPYQALNMAPGFNGTLSFDVVITDSSGKTLVRKNNNTFTYPQGL